MKRVYNETNATVEYNGGILTISTMDDNRYLFKGDIDVSYESYRDEDGEWVQELSIDGIIIHVGNPCIIFEEIKKILLD
jgi:hypothetical protein